MLDYTIIAFNKTVTDLKRIAFWITVAVQVLLTGFPLYSIIVDSGNTYINLSVAFVSAAFLAFYIIHDRLEKASISVKRTVKRVYKIIKYVCKLCNIAIAVYGVYVASEHTTAVSLAYIGFMILSLVFSILLDLAVIFCERRFELITVALKADFEWLTKTAGVINWVRGVENESEPPTESQKRAREFLDKERGQKKAEEKASRADVWHGRINGVLSVFRRKKEQDPQTENTEETATK